jgi:hypothetical protein
VNNLRSEWRDFYERYEPGPLHKELSQRAGSLSCVVLSHPGNQVFNPQHLESLPFRVLKGCSTGIYD